MLALSKRLVSLQHETLLHGTLKRLIIASSFSARSTTQHDTPRGLLLFVKESDAPYMHVYICKVRGGTRFVVRILPLFLTDHKDTATPATTTTSVNINNPNAQV
jgi:hypothetical protein